MVTKEGLFARTEPPRIGPFGRILWLLALLVISFCAWANWAQIDQQIRSPGEVIVSTRSKTVQAVDGGVLAVLHVEEGDVVQAGDLLAELERARFATHVAETLAQVLQMKATMQRLTAELDGTELDFSPDVAAVPALVEAQTNLYQRRTTLLREELAGLGRSLELEEKQLSALEALAATGDAARAEVLRARSKVAELRAKMTNNRNTYRAKAQEQLTEARGKLAQSVQVLKRHREALEATYLRAPVSGTVKEVSVSTIGAVLKSGEEIMQIVPSEAPLIVEAKVSPADVGFVRLGLPANVKLDAYDSAIYGSLKGEVTYISPDTIDEDLRRNEQPYYRVLVEITDIPRQSGAQELDIIPGMTGLVEIITGYRTVAQYLLKPLLRGSAAALTER